MASCSISRGQGTRVGRRHLLVQLTMNKEVVDTYYSEDGWHRVEIVRRSDRLLEIIPASWRRELVEGYGEVSEPYWSPNRSSPVKLCDTMERAKEMALEELRLLSGSDGWTGSWQEPTS